MGPDLSLAREYKRRVDGAFNGVDPDGRDQVRRLGRALERRLIADYDAVDILKTEDVAGTAGISNACLLTGGSGP